ncbi:MAG: hypothetical protein M1836_005021 [Candelina mexicana]|nr:MAG: hypothetical protein M1836_005021 [Candelina mexicana]
MAVDSLAGGKNTDALDKVGHTARGTFEALIPVESTFATEGAFWFPDLLVPDPHLLLPFILSGTMFTNIWLNTRLQNDGTEPSVFKRRLTNSLKFVALIIGPATLQMPSAMLVYWISSSSFAMLQNLLLDWIVPLDKPVKPCKPKTIESMQMNWKIAPWAKAGSQSLADLIMTVSKKFKGIKCFRIYRQSYAVGGKLGSESRVSTQINEAFNQRTLKVVCACWDEDEGDNEHWDAPLLPLSASRYRSFLDR